MASQPLSPYGYRDRASLRSRVAAFVLSVGILALIALVLLRMGMMGPAPPGTGTRLTAIRLSADSSEKHTATRHETAKASRARPPVPQLIPPPLIKREPLKLIPLSRDDFAAADISHMARHDSEAGGASGDSKSAYGPGEGPGGARLFNAEWFREPNRAEMAGYMPASGAAPGSWAMIACQTIERMHVDNCQQLDESPPGSGLARGLRQAAWQFLIRPPRIDGKPMIGAWVRIRFDFTRGAVE